jgi:hypothetical protein
MRTRPIDPRRLVLALVAAGLAVAVPRTAGGADEKPLEAVLVTADAATGDRGAGWKKEGFAAVAVVLGDDVDAPALQSAAKAVADNGLTLYVWVEVGRNPALARDHPEWMASLGTHDDWQKRFPKVRPPGKGEVAKAWPWVPIGYKETFDAHLARAKALLARVPAGCRGVLLNDLQGGPSACGCGNVQCRWATDYGVPSTATKLAGPGVAARFVAEVGKLAPDKEVIPVFTTECEEEDLPADKLPKGGWGTGYCGGVECLATCRKRYAEQWTALHADRTGPTGLLLLHKEFGRDRKEYGGPAEWVARGVGYAERAGAAPVARSRLWLVVQGYGVLAAEEAAARRVALTLGPKVVLVARTPIDQSYEPRVVPVTPAR